MEFIQWCILNIILPWHSRGYPMVRCQSYRYIQQRWSSFIHILCGLLLYRCNPMCKKCKLYFGSFTLLMMNRNTSGQWAFLYSKCFIFTIISHVSFLFPCWSFTYRHIVKVNRSCTLINQISTLWSHIKEYAQKTKNMWKMWLIWLHAFTNIWQYNKPMFEAQQQSEAEF